MVDEIKILISEYAGDVAWSRFVSNLDIESDQSAPHDELKAVITRVLGDDETRAEAWFRKKIPALGGHTPDYLLDNVQGLVALRSLVMRMP